MDFVTLPESLEVEELEEYFNIFLDEYEGKPKNLDALKQLYELAYSQWDTYEKLKDDIAVRIEKYIMDAMNLTSYDITDIIISIVENLSLKTIFHYLIDSKDSISSPSIKRLITEAEEEYSDTIDNPYDELDDWF